MKIIIIGMKSSGKSTVGKKLAIKLKVKFIELDKEIERKHNLLHTDNKSCKNIFMEFGESYFRNLETRTLTDLNARLTNKEFVLACGGGTPICEANQEILKKMGLIIFLDTQGNIIQKRICDKIWLTSFDKIYSVRWPIYEKLADVKIIIKDEKPDTIVSEILKLI